MQEAILLLILGGAAGFLSGLLGIGGGVLLVPALYFFFTSGSMQVAIGTSLAAAAVAAGIAAWRHAQLGGADRSVVLRILPTLLIGSLLGITIAEFF